MKLILENWRKYLNEEVIPDSVTDEIVSYLHSTGRTIDDVEMEQEIIPGNNRTDIEYWLKSKTKYEGEPPDKELIDKICKDGKITTPVIIDTDEEYTVEGRHRLFAALKCKIDVPVVAIFSKEESEELFEKWSDKERKKRKSKCDNPKGFTMKQFCKNQRTRSKKGQKKN